MPVLSGRVISSLALLYEPDWAWPPRRASEERGRGCIICNEGTKWGEESEVQEGGPGYCAETGGPAWRSQVERRERSTEKRNRKEERRSARNKPAQDSCLQPHLQYWHTHWLRGTLDYGRHVQLCWLFPDKGTRGTEIQPKWLLPSRELGRGLHLPRGTPFCNW